MNAFTAEYAEAIEACADRWVAACGGNEQPYTQDGVRYLYVFNPALCEHGYLNLDTDIVELDAPHWVSGLES